MGFTVCRDLHSTLSICFVLDACHMYIWCFFVASFLCLVGVLLRLSCVWLVLCCVFLVFGWCLVASFLCLVGVLRPRAIYRGTTWRADAHGGSRARAGERDRGVLLSRLIAVCARARARARPGGLFNGVSLMIGPHARAVAFAVPLLHVRAPYSQPRPTNSRRHEALDDPDGN